MVSFRKGGNVTDEELAKKLLQTHKEKKAREEHKEVERQKRLEGYLFWCSEGCGFVDEYHRCEQWTNITYVSPALIKAIKELP